MKSQGCLGALVSGILRTLLYLVLFGIAALIMLTIMLLILKGTP